MAIAIVVSPVPGGIAMSIATISSMPPVTMAHLGGLAAVAVDATEAAMVSGPSCPVGVQRVPVESILRPPLLCHEPPDMPIVCGSQPRVLANCGLPRLIQDWPPLSERARP